MNNLYYENQWIQDKQQEEYRQDCREIQKAAAKAAAIESVRVDSMLRKTCIKEWETEKRKAIFEELLVEPTGEIHLVTRNLSIEAKPRSITNMKNPTLVTLKRANDLTEQIYMIKSTTGSSEKRVYLEADMAGKAYYIVRKFASAGIYFKVSIAKAKILAVQLLCILLESCAEEIFLADKQGWFKMPDGNFQYVEEELTWEQAKKMCK